MIGNPQENMNNKIPRTSIIAFCVALILSSTIGFSQTGQPMIMPNGVSVPSSFPHVNITINDNPDTSLIFISTSWGSFPQYSMILDNSGNPIWYICTEGEERRDLKVQPNGWLTMLIRDGYGGSGWGYIALDEHYEYVRTFRAKNDYITDHHELQVLPDGGYLLFGLRGLEVNMNDYIPGDNRIVNVLENAIQEFDADDHLLRTYLAFDYFDLADLWPEQLQNSEQIDFPHMNSIDIDYDGNIILSSRYINEITKINRYTKEIIWRLGGAHSDFVFKNDELNGFYGQHCARVVGNNRYLLFDNGDFHNPPVSRAVEYELNLNDSTATLIWEFRDKPDRYSHYMGNVQRLPNRNTLINWSLEDYPKLTEVRPDCTKAFEMNYMDRHQCYRVHRCLWNGMAEKPYLIIEPHFDALVLLFNKFGDPNVDSYRIYAGTTPNPTTLYDTSEVTLKKITGLEDGTYWFRITAVSHSGQESGYSNEESVYFNFLNPTGNLINNGDFSDGKEGWTWMVHAGQAEWTTEDGEAHIDIIDGSNVDWHIQLFQNSIPLIHGEKYLFEFDARADTPRLIVAALYQDTEPWTGYSNTSYSGLKPEMTHFSYEFKMEAPTDFNARVDFEMGNSDIDVYIDNVSIRNITGTDVSEKPVSIPDHYELTGNYPNPFNPVTTICYTVPEPGLIKIVLDNVRGEEVKELVNHPHSPGDFQITFNASDLSSGLYFYKMDAYTLKGNLAFQSTHKMMLIK